MHPSTLNPPTSIPPDFSRFHNFYKYATSQKSGRKHVLKFYGWHCSSVGSVDALQFDPYTSEMPKNGSEAFLMEPVC